ncbi:MAG: GAF domain-containing protein [Rubrivivax sp.]|jgi:HD-GYP domain-containing protein (c-di-GMP phosphodiesterase class II)|nr:GAF domain-containing protein [Rubrivivax sp.]
MDNVDSLVKRLEQLDDIGASLSGERDIDRLLGKILLAAKDITHADGGTLYTVAPDGQHLNFRIVRTDSLGIAYGGKDEAPLPSHFKDLPLYLEDGQPNDHMVAAHVALTGETASIADAYEDRRFDFSGTRRFDASTGYRSTSFLTVPMKNHEGEVIGVLQLLNALDPDTGAVRPFTQGDQRLAESLGSQAAIALTNRLLMGQLEKLFESFVELIDTAIDEKSPYTGGHCARVPELTMMLAEAVNSNTEGPLAGFTLTDKDRYELRIAALLHDCGKVTTPVHVVDKATKLETIFDRIELLATRFAALKAQAQADMWRAVAQGEPEASARVRCEAQCRQLDEELAFLRHANKGSERMDDAAVRRVREMAERYRWVDDQGREQPLLNENEMENLTIRAGTLTAAEREVINHHIVATIQMLEKLPWPKHLARVPEFAGGHHERMDGKGYPKGLTREQMSLQARMVGIADIFEALTAADRPYKAPMKLSQALKIMDNFRDNGHIDPDLYALFISHHVPQRYAQKFLSPAQQDC